MAMAIQDLGTMHLVGNGQSKELWNPAQYPGDISIGCNLCDKVQLTAVFDRKVIDSVNTNKVRIRRPVILGPNSFQAAMEHMGTWKKLCIVGVVAEHPLRVLNAGAVALLWALRVGYTDFRLYGFDSLWTGLRATDSDEVWPSTAVDAPHRWWRSWAMIFERWPELVLDVVCPPESRIKMKSFNKHFRAVHTTLPPAQPPHGQEKD